MATNPQLKGIGTTSAHAENTPRPRQTATRTGNYLRARGEYAYAHLPGPLEKELPPRTRRIQSRAGPALTAGGTTSAHAENTSTNSRSTTAPWNYLRARGEYEFTPSSLVTSTELPPRTRRILAAQR